MTATTPMPDSEVNVHLRALKAAGHDEDAITAALTRLLATPAGRTSLVDHLADYAVLATEPDMTDAQRGRWLRTGWHQPDPEPTIRPAGLLERLRMAREAAGA